MVSLLCLCGHRSDSCDLTHTQLLFACVSPDVLHFAMFLQASQWREVDLVYSLYCLVYHYVPRNIAVVVMI